VAEPGEFVLNVARDFTTTPGHRYRKQGSWSGEEFRDDHLLPLFKRAVAAGARLRVELAGTQGYATSFLEEAFGGLSRLEGRAVVERHLDLVYDEDHVVIAEIKGYIKSATPQPK
jgi:hypothetical protein